MSNELLREAEESLFSCLHVVCSKCVGEELIVRVREIKEFGGGFGRKCARQKQLQKRLGQVKTES